MTEPSTPKKRTTFYIEANLQQDFKQICEREGEAMTVKVEDWIARYVQGHKEGNPQLPIEIFLPEKAEAMVLCGSLDGSKKGEVHCIRRGNWISATVCYGCDRNRLRKK